MENKSLADITAIIPTYNEEIHIERCILSIKDIVKRIVVIDSFSTDNTLNIVKKYNIEVFQKEYIHFADKMNWSLKNANIKTNWILRLDADEIMTKALAKEIFENLDYFSSNISAVSINREFIFLGKNINFGGVFPHRTTRIWKNGKAKMQNLLIDEEMIVDGDVVFMKGNIVDHNKLNGFKFWLKKHNKLSIIEAINFLVEKDKAYSIREATNLYKIYYKLPVILRSFLYFLYRYFFRLGFLNGWQGLVFHFFHGFWYRCLVDIKIIKLKRLMKSKKFTIQEAVRLQYGDNAITKGTYRGYSKEN